MIIVILYFLQIYCYSFKNIQNGFLFVVKFCHSGYLRNHNRRQRLRDLFVLMKLPTPPTKFQIPATQRMLENHGIDIEQCPNCKSGKMELVAIYYHGIRCIYEGRKSKPILINNKDPSMK